MILYSFISEKSLNRTKMQIFAENSRNFVQILCQMHRLLRLSLAFAILLAIISCTDRRYYQVGGYAQGGTWSVKYRGARTSPARVQSLVDSLLAEIDFTLSGYNKNSLLSKLNRGDTVVLTPMFCQAYRLSYEMWEQSSGAFDAASGPLFDIWGFGFTSGEMPSDDLVAKTLATCGTSRLIGPDAVDSLCRSGRPITGRDLLASSGRPITGRDLLASSGRPITGRDLLTSSGPLPVLNFNAIAQGFSCDLVFDMLRSLGVTDMLVDIGEIRCCGLNPSGKGWSIGIDNPVDGNDRPGQDIRQVWTSDGGDYGVVTSGNYRKFYIRDGRKYSHTIDPRTGYPVQHDLLSATVITPGSSPASGSPGQTFAAAEADALATIFMVIGFDASRDYLSSHPDLRAFLITSDTLWSSEAHN